MAWYFQATPHDDHDYDNNQSLSLGTIRVNGVERKIVTWTSRNGYFFTVDRTTGENIVTSKIFPNVNWAQDRTPSERDARAQSKQGRHPRGIARLAGIRRCA